MDAADTQQGSTTAQPPIRVRSLAEQHDLALAWFAASISGVIAITAIPDNLGAARMLTPLAAMVMFVAFGLSRSRFSTPRLADSIYFMGFLWTLWALIDVLVFSQQLRAQDLYNAFGYALIATASGMFIRLALLQFYRTVDDQEDQAVDQIDQAVTRLNDSVNALTRELGITQRSLSALRSDAARKVNEWHREFVDAAAKPVETLSQAATELEKGSKRLAETLTGVSDDLKPIAKTVKTVESRVSAASTKLADSVDQSGSALEASLKQFQANLAKVEKSPELLDLQIRQVAASLEQGLAPLRQVASCILKDVDEAIVSLGKAIVSLPNDPQLKEVAANLANELETLRMRSNSLAAATGSAAAEFKSAGEAAEVLAGSLSETRRGVQQALGGLQEDADKLRSSISEARQSSRDVDVALKDVVTFVRSEVARP